MKWGEVDGQPDIAMEYLTCKQSSLVSTQQGRDGESLVVEAVERDHEHNQKLIDNRYAWLMRIRGTEPAARDLTHICDFIQEHDSSATARRLALSVHNRLST
jgi:hypothetical protein